jgi:putative ABC transport system permease protein
VGERFDPAHPFEYHLLDQQWAASYASLERTGRLFRWGAGLAVIIACMGLFGLSAFVASRRRREISIRKVLGATVSSVVGLLCREFLLLAGLAFLVVSPIAYLAMSDWLGQFAYQIELGVGVFFASGLIAALLTLLAVSVHAARAALVQPAETLRNE